MQDVIHYAIETLTLLLAAACLLGQRRLGSELQAIRSDVAQPRPNLAPKVAVFGPDGRVHK